VPYVYLLRCRDGSLYAGAAKELAPRLAKHRAGKASRYTRSRLPVELVWWREVAGWGEALRAELRLKSLDRAGKEELVSAGSAGTDAASAASAADGDDAGAGAAPSARSAGSAGSAGSD
jgi:putative endonuclease